MPLSSNQMKLCRDIIVQSICLIVLPNTAVCTYPCNILEHGTCERAELPRGLDTQPADEGGIEEVLHRPAQCMP